MPTPMLRRPDATAIFAPQYYGSVRYYAAMAQYGHAVVDLGMRYDKRFKSVHRCEIIDANGPLRLTVPLSKQAPRLWSQLTVSSHGQWWTDHLVSLESAYGRTPFFEFYIDRFMPWLRDVSMPITEMDRGIDRQVRAILGLDTQVEYSEGRPGWVPEAADLRRAPLTMVTDVPYYQVRSYRHGFVPGLSILDLIFNMGPEAPLVLAQMGRK